MTNGSLDGGLLMTGVMSSTPSSKVIAGPETIDDYG